MHTPGADSKYDSGPELLRDIWALAAVTVVVVSLRVYAKFRIAKSGWDDILMTFALVSEAFIYLTPSDNTPISTSYLHPRSDTNQSL
jgi:hypothetical protein